MWKNMLLAGTAAVMLAGSTLVYAQQPGGQAEPVAPAAPAGITGQPGAPGTPGWQHPGADGRGGEWQLSPQDRAAFLDARIAGLKAGLQLTPDQEKNWPAFESALRGLAKVHQENRQARAQLRQQEGQPQDAVERLRRRAAMLSNMGAALKQVADTEQPLLASLNDDQKRRFAIFARMARQHMAMMRRGRFEQGHGEHHGFGGPEGWRGREGFGGHGGPMWMRRGENAGENTNGEGAATPDAE